MDFRTCFSNQLSLYTPHRPADLVKLCFQAAFGAEHMLRDVEAARKRFLAEYHQAELTTANLYELLSPEFCKISLPAWKTAGLPAEWLFRAFAYSTFMNQDRESRIPLFHQYIHEAMELVPEELRTETIEFLKEYPVNEPVAIHHSAEYKAANKPSYRLLTSKIIPILPVLKQLAKFSSLYGVHVLTIDGRSGSGKSTMSDFLAAILRADIVHMDDFYLPPELRSEQRVNDPGGNVHYERFLREILPFLHSREGFSYPIYDCSVMKYVKERNIPPSPKEDRACYRIVEGSYSLHPIFGDYSDVSVFSDISPEVQKKRLTERESPEKFQMFVSTWIPREEKYFDTFRIREKADFVISGEFWEE